MHYTNSQVPMLDAHCLYYYITIVTIINIIIITITIAIAIIVILTQPVKAEGCPP